MTQKEKIQYDFVVAIKDRNEIAKSALSSLKAKITEAEKANKNKILSDEEVLKVVISCIKQRKQSYDEYIKAGRSDLADIEANEIEVLQEYMPDQMTKDEIKKVISEIMANFSSAMKNEKALVGKTIGEFNKKFPGRADNKLVHLIGNEVVKDYFSQ